MKTPNCIQGHGPMEPMKKALSATLKGVDIAFETDIFVCRECGFEAGTIQSAGATQRTMAEAYRRKVGLLTGEEIRSLRKAKGLSQQDLAKRMGGVGIASIKRWETGVVQSQSMDTLLRRTLQNHLEGQDTCTGNREFSVARTKLVLQVLGQSLGRELLRKGDKFLYVAKYLWYADLLAYRLLGRSMTGASYAALPQGPQLNNYRDLVESIRDADEAKAEPLNSDEKRILQRLAKTFPTDSAAYNAAHREPFLQRFGIGCLIPYSVASEITEIKL